MRKQITIVGIGMGNENTLTIEAKEAINDAQAVIGAKRMVDACKKEHQDTLYSYKPEEIKAWIRESSKEKFAIVMSGDTGFYSGTKELIETLEEYSVQVLPGISSLSYFAAKLKKSWEDAKIMSLHGRNADVVGTVRRNEKTFLLTGGNVKEVCRTLMEAGLIDVTVWIGERLSYEEERIHTGTPEELMDGEYDSLSVMLIENKAYEKRLQIGISDEAFIRGKVPMTKSEVRAVILSKLQVEEGTIAYDIGAGTGSVSIELALAIGSGTVYAIEQKEEAVALIHQNKRAFAAGNLEVIQGCAPEAMAGLPAPASVFIGGSSGNMREILAKLMEFEGKIRIVASAIALETLAEVISLYQEYLISDVDIAQVTVAKSKEVGRYHMMTGQNPIFIISGTKEERNED